MVVLGQWPYQHTITLDQLRRQAGAGAYYFVDEDRIVSRGRALELEKLGFIIDDPLLTIMSETMQSYVSAFANQDFPPPVQTSVAPLIRTNTNQQFSNMMDRVKNSAAALIVNDQNGEVMEDIGAAWNSMLGVWIVDSVALRTLREKRRQKTDGRVEIRQDKGGVFVEVYGDVTPHVDILKNVGGKYDEDKDVWYVPMSAAHKIMHIAS